MERLEEKMGRLRQRLGGSDGLVVAFSGGVDSAVLLALALEAHRGPVVAATVTSSLQPAGEDDQAAELAAGLGADHRVLALELLADEAIRQNALDRCYVCKRRIVTELQALARAEGLGEVIEGSNVDDQGDHRPGERAVAELGVGSPLREAGLTKAEVRHSARERGLKVWDKPALSCLATRVPFGEPLTAERLARIDRAEALLRRAGFVEVRLRDHGVLARIEVPAEQVPRLVEPARRQRVVAELTALGYTFVAVDLVGYRTGAMNEALSAGGGPR